MRIAIAGGGTGGHISPAIAVAESIWSVDPSTVIDFLGTPRPVDARMYSRFGDHFHILHPPRVDRGPAGALLLPFRALASLKESRGLIRRLGSEVLFATGGYPSFFPVLAAKTLGIPSIIHESNSVPGRANRMAARFATEILTGFRAAGAAFHRPVTCTGNPIRSSLRRMDPSAALACLGLREGFRTVLFLGGSQGAMALNGMVPSAPPGVNVIVQCGAADEQRMRESCAGNPGVLTVGFMDDPSVLYSAADLAVARAGSMTIAELAWYRLPSVLVPYPSAAAIISGSTRGKLPPRVERRSSRRIIWRWSCGRSYCTCLRIGRRSVPCGRLWPSGCLATRPTPLRPA
jgi:UDP-N-acetylglucosamine--N-acetylmuramyl-(pentapeptide) pyrophosphoryl-undecaprenol N-acetylglucosamine transferase